MHGHMNVKSRNSFVVRGKLSSCIRIHSRITVYTSSLL